MTDYREGIAHDEQARRRYLQPLADAFVIHARIEDAAVEQTGGGVLCAEGTMPNGWRVDADEFGWSFSDPDGSTVAMGGWYEGEEDAYRRLPADGDVLDADEADAAARVLLTAYEAVQA